MYGPPVWKVYPILTYPPTYGMRRSASQLLGLPNVFFQKINFVGESRVLCSQPDKFRPKASKSLLKASNVHFLINGLYCRLF